MSTTLLDTHALIWLMEEDQSLGRQSRQLADTAVRESKLFVSAITFWETAMLAQRRRILLAQPLRNWRQKVLELGIEEIPMSGDIGILAVELEDFHPDPADRIVTATALVHGATLVTADARILEWAGSLVRHNART
jgi:PIN domain nuclease of toxin-antitoxin system